MLQIVTLLTFIITAAVWSTRRKVEMSEFEEWHLRLVVLESQHAAFEQESGD